MARLLALVADLLAATGVLRAVAGEVASLATVIALRAVDAVTWGLVRTLSIMKPERACTYGTCDQRRRTSSRSCSAGNRRRSHRTGSHVHRSCHRPWSSCEQCGRPRRTLTVSADEQTDGAEKEAHLVALSAGGAAGTASGARLGAVARDVTSSAAAVAGLGVLGALGAVTAHVALACSRERDGSATVKRESRTCSKGAYHRSCSTWQRHGWGSHEPI